VAANLLQQGLADRLADSMQASHPRHERPGVDDKMVSSWETGEHWPSRPYREHLAIVLGKTQEELGLIPPRRLWRKHPLPIVPDDDAMVDVAALATELGQPAGPQDRKDHEGAPAPSPDAFSSALALHQQSAERYIGVVWKPAALASGVAACVLLALAVLQIGPFAKTTVILEGVPTRPAPSTPKAQPQGAINAPDCQGPISQKLDSPRNGMHILIDVATTKPACWTQGLSPVNPGTTLRYLIEYYNSSKFPEPNVVIGVNLAPGVKLIPNTTLIYNGEFPHGTPDNANNIASGGVDIGNYKPGAGAYVQFDAALPLAGGADCGWNKFSTVGWGQANGTTKSIKLRGDQYYNSAEADIYKKC
jgi:hypothetical protein